MPRPVRPPPFLVEVSAELPIPRAEAFETVVEELVEALGRRGIRFVPGPGGTVTEDGAAVGRVEAWVPKKRVRFAWSPAPWKPDERTEVELRFEDEGAGTRVALAHRGGAGLFGDPTEAAGWVAGAVFASVLGQVAPRALGDWVTDRVARRPSGRAARRTYTEPTYHRPNFALLLELLDLGPRDRLLEVGCGGGAFLAEALRTGCRATAIDHSPEMVRLARANNADAVRSGRLEVIEADARGLPVPSSAFTCAVSTGVLGFLPDPLATFREVHRALADGGRFVLYAGTRELAGTLGCPQPVAARVRFYDDHELEALARQAGFRDAEVRRPVLEGYARKLGLPDEVVAAFRTGEGNQLLVARKGRS